MVRLGTNLPIAPLPFAPALLALAVCGALAKTTRAQTQPPDRVPRSFTSLGIGSGGAQFGPAFDPHAPTRQFVGSDMSHLQRSTDGGATWQVVDHREIQTGSLAQLAFTGTPGECWSLDFSGDDLGKLVRSTDGGATWSAAPTDPTNGDAWSVWADTSGSGRMLVAGYARLYASANGGTSFQQVWQDTANGVRVAGVVWDTTSIHVGTNTGVLVSTNGGAAFAAAGYGGWPANTGCAAFCGARGIGPGAALRLFAVTAPTGALYPGVTGADYAVTNGVRVLDAGPGATWQLRTTGLDGQPFFAAMATMAPDPVVCWLAGSRWNGSEQSPAVWRTTDGGLTWQSVLQTQFNANVATGWSGHGGDRGWSYGEYALGFAVDPANGARALVSDLGGFHRTDDGGASWRAGFVAAASLNPAGAPTPRYRSYTSNGSQNTSVWALCWADADTVLACASDVRAMRSTNGGATWSLDFTGHTQNTLCHAVRHANGTLYAGSSTAHDLYQSTYLTDARLDPAGGRLLASADGGRQWTALRDFGDPVVWLALDPARPATLYASTIDHGGGDGGIWRTDDVTSGTAATWVRLAPPPRTEGHPFVVRVLDDGTLVATYCARRDANGAFTASSGVFVSTDRGATWLDRSAPNMLWWTKDLVVAPGDPSQSTWLVGVWSGWGGAPNGRGGLYRTTDRGVTWQRIWQSDRVSSCTFDPLDDDFVFVTTETQGLWCSANVRAAAPAFQPVTGFPFRQPERVFFAPHDPCELWVTTFGNGVWRGDNAFADLGHGKPGSTVSRLSACVQLSPGTTARYVVHRGVANMPGVMAYSLQQGVVPLLGGTLVPYPVQATAGAVLDAAGACVLSFVTPPSALLGTEVFAQFWSLDAGASFGLAATNALGTSVR
jgi:hypothetical protein